MQFGYGLWALWGLGFMSYVLGLIRWMGCECDTLGDVRGKAPDTYERGTHWKH